MRANCSSSRLLCPAWRGSRAPVCSFLTSAVRKSPASMAADLGERGLDPAQVEVFVLQQAHATAVGVQWATAARPREPAGDPAPSRRAARTANRTHFVRGNGQGLSLAALGVPSGRANKVEGLLHRPRTGNRRGSGQAFHAGFRFIVTLVGRVAHRATPGAGGSRPESFAEPACCTACRTGVTRSQEGGGASAGEGDTASSRDSTRGMHHMLPRRHRTWHRDRSIRRRGT